jgi:hypothetical protein
MSVFSQILLSSDSLIHGSSGTLRESIYLSIMLSLHMSWLNEVPVSVSYMLRLHLDGTFLPIGNQNYRLEAGADQHAAVFWRFQTLPDGSLEQINANFRKKGVCFAVLTNCVFSGPIQKQRRIPSFRPDLCSVRSLK